MKRILLASVLFIVWVFEASVPVSSQMIGSHSECYNVLDYGLVSDGTTDNYPAFQTLITQTMPQQYFVSNVVSGAGTLAPYGCIYWPAGNYHFVTGPINIPVFSRITMTGAGRAYEDTSIGIGTNATPTPAKASAATIISSAYAGAGSNGVGSVVNIPSYSTYGDSSTVTIRDMDFRIDGAQSHNASAIYGVGCESCRFENIGVINDPRVSALKCQDGNGLTVNGGGANDDMVIIGVNVGCFGNGPSRYNAQFIGNHMVVDDIHVDGNNSCVNGVEIGPVGERAEIGTIHLFLLGGTGCSNNPSLISLLSQASDYLTQTVFIRDLSLDDDKASASQSGLFTRSDSKTLFHIGRFMNGSALTNAQIFGTGYGTWISADYINGYNSIAGAPDKLFSNGVGLNANGSTVLGYLHANSAGLVNIGQTTAPTDTTGSVALTAVVAGGTINVSGCSLSEATGGASAGSFMAGASGTCAVTITPGIAAPHGFVCDAKDLTTTTHTLVQTAFTTTTCTVSGTTVSGDDIVFEVGKAF